MRPLLPLTALSLLVPPAAAQSPDFEVFGSFATDWAGWALAYGHHSTNLQMLFVGVPGDSTAGAGAGAGAVRVYRQDNGVLDSTFFRGDTLDSFGRALSTSGDLDGDGRRDLLVGASGADPTGVISGAVYAFSGADFSEFPWSPVQHGATQFQAHFGGAVAIVDDRNGDGRDDFLVGAALVDTGVFVPVVDAGAVFLFSGADGSQLDALGSTQAGAHLGTSVARTGDVDGDGLDDVLVGEPRYDGAAGADAGRARVLSLATLDEVPAYTVEGLQAGAQLGTCVASGGDFDRDGSPDHVLGAPYHDLGSGPFLLNDVGRVEVRAGDDNAVLATYLGGVGERLGHSAALDGDLNRDGYDDVLLGGPGRNGGDGGVRAYSGRTGECLYDFAGSGEEAAGFAVALGRPNPITIDRYADFAVGRPEHDALGFPSQSNAGAATQYHGKVQWVFPRFPGHGYDVDVMGDVDLDGMDDLLVGIRREDDFPLYGWSIRSGKDGHVLLEDVGAPACVGSAVCALPDLTGDGTPDFALGSPCDQSVRLMNGLTGTAVWTFSVGGDAFGHDLDRAGDLNDDGFEDVVVGDPGYDGDRGRVTVYRLQPLPGLLSIGPTGGSAGDRLGWSVAGLGDVDGDGEEDYAAGAPYFDSGGAADAGRVYVVSGATGGTLFTATGSAAGDRAGWSVAGVGDVNGDGFADVAVGEPFASPGGLGEAGRVRVWAGPSGGTVLHQFDGDQAGMHLGWRVARIGDADRDGRPDVACSAPDWDWAVFGETDNGLSRVYSGATGALVGSFPGPESHARVGLALGARAEAGPDDRNELALGSPNGLYEGGIGLLAVDLLPESDVIGIGNACGGGGFTPAITSSSPLLGELMTLGVSDAELGVAVLWIALDDGFFPLGGGCTLRIDPTTIVATIALSGAGTSFEIEALVPDGPAAVGASLYAQAIVPLSAAPLGFGLTRMRELVVGY